MPKGLYYLAHPYASDPLLNTFAVTRIAARLIGKGYHIYSPLTMTHHIDVELKYMKIDISNEQWVEYDFTILDRCDAIIMAGSWQLSKGCMREFQRMRDRGKPVYIYNPLYNEIDEYISD